MPLVPQTVPSTAAPRRIRLALAVIAVGVAALHGVVWERLAAPRGEAAASAARAPAVQVRTLPQVAMHAERVAIAPVPRPAPPARPKVTEVTEAAEPATPPLAAAEPERVAPVELAPPVLVASALPQQAFEAAQMVTVANTPEREDVPVYRTTAPPSITLQYTMSRGMVSGTGELQWRRSAKGYEAKLQGRVAGFNILTWTSQGAFDKAGLAPARYTDSRRGKAEQAANFQRQAGKITYSGPSTEYPLLDGSQDRLSWMIQVAAIAAADPQLLAPGGRIAMFVSGARGDADVWSFKVQGVETVDTGDTRRRAVKLLREPRKPHDTRVEVWLDPAEHHLPVRARLSSDNDTLELVLQTTQQPS
jgi:hypothetical protein